jgi:tetratricopeptide (TPR) repeat protein
MGPDRRPTAQELEALAASVRRDPASPAFVELAEAYLALGRPKQAIEVGTAGIAAAPDRVEGRVAVARAHMALHQWKEAQGELLKVVKVDRGNRAGFALLGEVLLRRSDYERAIPVLQHAQNLDPTSPAVLVALRRARAGEALDPPPPVPTALEPRGGEAPPATRSAAELAASADDVAAQIEASRAAPSAAPRRAAPPSKPPPPPGGRAAPSPSVPPPIAAAKPAPVSAPPAPEPVVEQPPAPRPAPRPAPAARPAASVPTTATGEPVRPRVVGSDRKQNAAQASLRRSAAVGEGYLNDLLTGGLLAVGGVNVPEQTYDLKPDRRWGRSTRRMFIFLFTVAILVVGGGGGWWWYAGKQRARAIASLQEKSQVQLATGSHAGFTESLASLKAALVKQKDNPLTFAYVAYAAGLDALLYGADPGTADEALQGAKSAITKPTQKGYRELVLGQAAAQLARLDTLDAPALALSETNLALDAWLADHADDAWARWLKARAQLAAGQRTAAMSSLKEAAKHPIALPPAAPSADAPPPGAATTAPLSLALIDRADLLVDDGKFDEAMTLYGEVLAVHKDHPLALLGRALARAESGSDPSAAVDDLSVKLDKLTGRRIVAYRELSLGIAKLALDDYAGFSESLAKVSLPLEPRLTMRLALAQVQRGDLAAAATAFSTVKYFGKDKAEGEPLADMVNVSLLLAAGLPEKALELASKLDGTRARLLRAQALLDLERGKDAAVELEAVLAVSAENLEAQILLAYAQSLEATGDARTEALAQLEKLGRKAKSKLGRHAAGMAQLAAGNLDEAKKRLGMALEDISDDSPNPLVYRTHTALAQVLIALGDLEGAGAELEKATTANSGYLPARALRAKLVLAKGDADAALELLAPVLAEGAVTPSVELVQAEALVARKKVTDEDRQKATELITRLAKSKLPPAELARVALRIDPTLPTTLGLPLPEGAVPAVAPEPPPSRRRRGR